MPDQEPNVTSDQLPEETKVLLLDEMGNFIPQTPADPKTETPEADQGAVSYDTPPEVRGRTITVDFNELPGPQPEPALCCTGAINASLQFNGRRTLCLACATIYQYGFRVGKQSTVRRRPRG